MTISFTNVDFHQVGLLILFSLLIILLGLLIINLVLSAIFIFKKVRFISIKLILFRQQIKSNKNLSKRKRRDLAQEKINTTAHSDTLGDQKEFNTNDYDDIKNNAKNIIKNLTTIQEGSYEDVTEIKSDIQISIDSANVILKKFGNETDEGEKL